MSSHLHLTTSRLTIETGQSGHTCGTQSPGANRTCDRVFTLVEIVHQACGEADVRVQDEGERQGGIQDTAGSVLDSACGHEGKQGDGDTTLSEPVVRTVRSIRRREGCRLVDGAFDVCWQGVV